MQDVKDFYTQAQDLISAADSFVKKFDLGEIAAADHIGYKCDSRETFERVRAMLEPESTFVYQSYISGRRIAIFKLKTSFESAAGAISFLELNDQKPDNSQTTRFDHIEIYPVGVTYEELASTIKERGGVLKEVVRPHHTTYDIDLGEGFTIKLTREPLVEKIKRDEMK